MLTCPEADEPCMSLPRSSWLNEKLTLPLPLMDDSHSGAAVMFAVLRPSWETGCHTASCQLQCRDATRNPGAEQGTHRGL